MEPGASDTLLGRMKRNNDTNYQAVHNSKSKKTEPELTGPCPQTIHTDSCNADSSYTVTCTVCMVLAVPRGQEDVPIMAAEAGRQLKKVQPKYTAELPKVQTYYHIEYNLLPDDSEPIKVDLVMCGLMAKVYMDNETKVLKVWQEGDHLWLGWSQSVKLNVTKELLIKMSSHKITFRLWDTKDRVSPKAKYDRPKAFRLPRRGRMEDTDQRGPSLDGEPESAGGVKGMVYRLRALYEKQNPKTTTSKKYQKDTTLKDIKGPSSLKCGTDDPKLSTMEASGVRERPLSSAVLITDGLLAQEGAFSKQSYRGKQNPETSDTKSIRSEATADQANDMILSKLTQKRSLDHHLKSLRDSTTICSTKSGTLMDSSLVPSKKKHAHKTVQERAEEEDIRKNGIASSELEARYFLAGETSLVDYLIIRCARVFKSLCSITLDKPLLSEELKAELNPLIIKILSVSSLPSTPVPFYDLEQKCVPVYCQYKFLNMPTHRTKGLSHGPNIFFKDINVIFTGLLNTEELLEFLSGPPLEIEVHDRDRKAKELHSSPSIFGTEATDDKLGSTALVPTQQTTYSPFRETRKLCDPYGIAKLNLSDILRGQGCLKLTLPIRGSHPVQLLGTDKYEQGENEPETAGALDVQDKAMPNGHYLKANSELKVQVEIAHPPNPDPDKHERHCPFGRIIYIFKYNNIAFLEKLKSEILRINIAAFQKHNYNKEMDQTFLQDHVMDATERHNKDLNALTGFHLLDQALHIFVLEGLKDEAIKTLWETAPVELAEDVEKHVTVLYNSGLRFSKRLYDTLDVGLSPIHLHKPLETIMKQPLVYIRDSIPDSCLQAMLRINHLCQVSKLEEVVQSSLFPSAEMVRSLRNEFGIIPSRGVEKLTPDSSEAKVVVHSHLSQKRKSTPLDNFNKDYLAWKNSQANQGLYTKHFIQANIEEIQRATSGLQTLKPKVFVAEVDDGQLAHNYSIQTFNSTSLAKELLRKEMAKDPSRRFTYSQHYHSLTVDPVDIEDEHKASEAMSRAAWRTWKGFICHDVRNSMESNQHPQQPDEARVDELRKPWKENILHENIRKPVLNRSTWPWSKRHEDFELYRKPPAVFSPAPPITIHLAGELLRQEQLQAAHAQYVRWRSKILADKESTSCGRVPEFKCHMQRVGLDKLHDILKDKPMKLSLRAWTGSLPVPYIDPHKEEKLELSRLPDKHTKARRDSEHSKPQFRRYWRSHSFQHKRTASPLTDEEKSLYVFQSPLNSTMKYTDLADIQHLRNVVETRTINSLDLHIK